MIRWLIALPFLVACSAGPAVSTSTSTSTTSTGSGNGSGGSSSSGGGSSGSSGDLFYVATAEGACEGDEPLSACDTSVDVLVHDRDGTSLDDAVVTANGIPVPRVSSGHYRARNTGWSESFAFVVTRSGERVSSTLITPRDFTVSLTPESPAAGTGATVTWTPANQPDIEAQVGVYGGFGNQITAGSAADEGTYALSTDAFPASGTYSLKVSRRWFLPQDATTDPMSSPSNVRLERDLSVTVP